MERYNLIFTDDFDYKDMRIITTKSYLKKLKTDPGFLHENAGDFYSNIKTNDLAEKIYNSITSGFKDISNVLKSEKLITGEKDEKNIMLIDKKDFNKQNLDKNLEYVIKISDGAIFYSYLVNDPSLKDLDAKEFYMSFISMLFLPELFSAEKEGTLQKEFKQENEMFEKMKLYNKIL